MLLILACMCEDVLMIPTEYLSSCTTWAPLYTKLEENDKVQYFWHMVLSWQSSSPVMNVSTDIYQLLLKMSVLQLMEMYLCRGCPDRVRTRSRRESSVNQLRGVHFPRSSPKWNFPWEAEAPHVHLVLLKGRREAAEAAPWKSCWVNTLSHCWTADMGKVAKLGVCCCELPTAPVLLHLLNIMSSWS